MHEEIYLKMQNFIIKSCNFESFPSVIYREFHKDYLKLCFGVLDAEVDYKNKRITLWSPKPLNVDSFELKDFKNSMLGIINYEDLEATLLGCMKDDDFHIRFYRHFLLAYSKNSSTLKL